MRCADRTPPPAVIKRPTPPKGNCRKGHAAPVGPTRTAAPHAAGPKWKTHFDTPPSPPPKPRGNPNRPSNWEPSPAVRDSDDQGAGAGGTTGGFGDPTASPETTTTIRTVAARVAHSTCRKAADTATAAAAARAAGVERVRVRRRRAGRVRRSAGTARQCFRGFDNAGPWRAIPEQHKRRSGAGDRREFWKKAAPTTPRSAPHEDRRRGAVKVCVLSAHVET